MILYNRTPGEKFDLWIARIAAWILCGSIAMAIFAVSQVWG